MSETYVYSFGGGQADGRGDMKDVLGGKGAALAEMTRAGIPVPPGFTITTGACNLYQAQGKLSSAVTDQQAEALARLEETTGKKLGDSDDPLLVSVRSGAKFSMPGMMDTILNLGLNDHSVEGLAVKTDNRRFALDSYRRFLQMFGNVVLQIEKDVFEHELTGLKKERGLKLDTEMTTKDLADLVDIFKAKIREQTGSDFPQDPRTQLDMARDAVFRSWNNERAVYYRRQNDIPDDLGTAVNVQSMVFGNKGDGSGTGVGFTRNPSTGVNEFYGEYLLNAQGEDVVAGIRTPHPLADLEKDMPKCYAQLREITGRLETHYRDVQDFEFTIEDGNLFMLQTRNGKRTAQAAIKIAVDMVKEGLIDEKEALLRVQPEQLDQLLHRRVDPKAKAEVLAKGLAASPGAAVGKIVFDSHEAVEAAAAGEAVVLVRMETNPDDIRGMDAAKGILTATGGMTSHAAVVARGMGKCCVAGCSAVEIHEKDGYFLVAGKKFSRGDVITLNGSTGEVLEGAVSTLPPEMSAEFQTFMGWADEVRGLRVRANADIPRDAAQAREFGAQGIGLCRTEHMFFAEDRLPWVRQMILNGPTAKSLRKRLTGLEREMADAGGARKEKLETEAKRVREALAEPQRLFDEALAKMLPLQREDFHGILKAMEGLPVTIRTLDPPLHEFLPSKQELAVEIALLETKGDSAELEQKRHLYRVVEELTEFNPMLGHRGCRLGISFPELTAMQSRAILEAASGLLKENIRVFPEIMIPLVGDVREFRHQRAIVDQVAREVQQATGVEVPYLVGTMIEVPRAALTADEIATEAQFFSFGTNDLTQMTYGYSRDDVSKFLYEYIEVGILDRDPFVSLDQTGVGQLVAGAVEKGRGARTDIKIGICGEHGGDPRSIDFCYRHALNYVSCSPYRVPIARLAAAQATLRHQEGTEAPDATR
ncbi:MAG: pyruvate, phosphate dikinase [Candidatus Eisenbacteria bacterium]|nr:pyruvate, phosphate dikinase [Candidatus Eisenbacteria bacterium]